MAMSRDFQWDLMRSFLAVLREGSLGKAARSVGASQPSVGRHIKQLEQQLGADLFERRARRFVATPFALRLASAAEGMQTGAADVARLLAERHAEETRSVRISASRMAATHMLPAPLAILAQREHAPSIELIADDQLANLAEREADIAVRLVRPTQASLIARRVGSVHFGIYGARSYFKRRPPPVRVAELAAHAVIGFDRSQLMIRGAQKLGLVMERSAFLFRSDDRVVHWAATCAGLGIGVLPTYLGERESALLRVLPEYRLSAGGVWLVARRDVLARAAVKLVFDGLRDQLVPLLAGARP